MREPETPSGRKFLDDWRRDPKELATIEAVAEAIVFIEADAHEQGYFERSKTVLIERDEALADLVARIIEHVEALPEPTLGLKGGVGRAAVLAAIRNAVQR